MQDFDDDEDFPSAGLAGKAKTEDTLKRRWLLLRAIQEWPETRSTAELAARIARQLAIELLPDSRDTAWRAFLRKIERDLKALSESPEQWGGVLQSMPGERNSRRWFRPARSRALLPAGLTQDEALDFWLIEQHLSPSFPISALKGLAGYFAMARNVATEHRHWSQQFRVLARQRPCCKTPAEAAQVNAG